MGKLISALVFLLLILPGLVVRAEVNLPVSPYLTLSLYDDDDEFETDNAKKVEKKIDTVKADSKKGEGKKPALMPVSKNQDISRTKAVLLSLLVPGAGQIYADAKGRGEVFLGAEVAIWVGYFAFNTYGHWKEDDYRNYAVRHAGIEPGGKDEEFYRNLTFYDSREEYNTAGRIIDPTGPYYPPGPFYDWYWDESGNRQTYRAIKNASESAFRKATFMLGAAVFNRILSSIDAFRIAKGKAHEIKDNEFLTRNNIDIHLTGTPLGTNPRVNLELTRRF